MTDNNRTTSTDTTNTSNVLPFSGAAGTFNGTAALHLDHTERAEGLPPGYLLNEDGIHELRPSGDGDDIPVHICSPIHVRGLCCRADGSDWGRVVDIRDPNGMMHRHIIDEGALSGGPAALLRPLRARGLSVEPVEKAAQSVAKLLQSWRPATRFTRADALGWTDNSFKAFTLGTGEVIGDARVVFQHRFGDIGDAMRARGSLDEWRQAVAALCVDNPLMILAVSQAFSGPFLWPLSMDGGGFHLRGASSRGKSTLLGVAASVWGAPSFMQSWRATDNGIEGIASACSNTLLVLDELYQVSPKSAGEIVYMLGNGRGKARAQANGVAQPVSRWHVPVLSSGEISLEEHMAKGGMRVQAGQETRLLDISADTRRYGAFDCLHGMPEGHLFAERMQRAVGQYHGTAGPAFVKRLMKHAVEHPGYLRFVDRFLDSARTFVDLPPDGQVQRALRRFAVAALAGEVATKFKITGWTPGLANRAAMESFRIWFDERDGATRSDIAACVGRTKDFIPKNGDRFLRVGEAPAGSHLGWKDDVWYYILPDIWKSIHIDEDAVEAARLHHAAGFLKAQKGSGLQYRMGRRVEGRPKTYAVNISVLKE